MAKTNSIGDREKIVVLWMVFLLGMLFHTQLGLMPLFHGIDVAMMGHARQESSTVEEITPILWGMLIFFVLPLLAIVATAFYDFNRYRVLHFGLTVVYTVLNSIHAIADLLVDPIAWYQIALMVFLFLIGILLNIVSYQWMRIGSRRHKISSIVE